MFVVAVAALVLFSNGSAEAAMYVDSEERRTGLLGSFVLIAGLSSALCILVMFMERNSQNIEEPQAYSAVVPPIKQESNIVQDIIHTWAKQAQGSFASLRSRFSQHFLQPLQSAPFSRRLHTPCTLTLSHERLRASGPLPQK